jgi:hypothetical protein
MKRNMFVSVIVVFLLSALIVSCKKGDTGATGPAGTANVIYSDWFTPSAYTKDTIFGIWGLNYNKAATSFTQQVLDSGTVLTFGRLSGYNPIIWPTGQVAQLPISLTYISGSTVTDTWSALATVGNLRIRFVNDHNIYNSISNAHSFRYIIIPGGKSGGRMMPQSYSEICKQYNIPE